MRSPATSHGLRETQATQSARMLGIVSASIVAGYVIAALGGGSRSFVLRLCPFYLVTHRDCPLCGLTRGLGMIGEGHVREAFGQHGLALANGMLLVSFAALRVGRSRTPATIGR